jgi:restriction system protein
MNDSSPDIPVFRINQILKTVFELLWFEPQGLYVSDIIKYLRDAIPFNDYETGKYPFAPYLPRYEVVVRIGTIPLVKAGWMEKTKNGRWFITNAGRNACRHFKNSNEFFDISVQLFEQWKLKESRRLSLLNTDPFIKANELSWAQIKQYFEILDIRDIRTIVSSLLKAVGCHILWVIPFTDENSPIDMICTQDPLGIRPPRMVVHISKTSEVTTEEGINFFLKDLNPSDVGIYFSFGGFAAGLKEFSLERNKPVVRLIDMERFVDLWVNNLDKIDSQGYSKFPLRPIHFLALPDRI